MKKRTYRTILVQNVDVQELSRQLGDAQKCVVAIDIAKEAMVAGFCTDKGVCVSLVRFSHPTLTIVFLRLLEAIRDRGHAIEVAMEPTGVYGDALRYQLVRCGFEVFRVDAVRAHAIAAVLDGVPSSHDAKSCTLIGYLHVQGISTPWVERGNRERDLRSLMDERELFAKPFEAMHSQLHSRMARHLPEWMDEYASHNTWHLKVLSEYPSPAHITNTPQEAAEFLRRASRGKLSKERIAHLMSLAKHSMGVPMSELESARIKSQALHMLDLRSKVAEVDERIAEVVHGDPSLAHFVETFGPTTTAAIFADAGDPSRFSSTGAFQKALGLNLKERSSGTKQGALRITKRGPSRARHYLFMAALRFIYRSDIVRAWYQARNSYKAGLKLKAIVAVMRKIARAMPHVARGEPLTLEKLFDQRRLNANVVATIPSAAS